jgi:hypothetical protein
LVSPSDAGETMIAQEFFFGWANPTTFWSAKGF